MLIRVKALLWSILVNPKSAFEHNGGSDAIIQSNAHMVTNPEAQPSPSINPEETKSVNTLTEKDA